MNQPSPFRRILYALFFVGLFVFGAPFLMTIGPGQSVWFPVAMLGVAVLTVLWHVLDRLRKNPIPPQSKAHLRRLLRRIL